MGKFKRAMCDSDGNFVKTYNVGGKPLKTLEFRYWHNMKTRATNPNYKKKYPTYKDVTMSDLFSDYNQFCWWADKQVGFGNEDFVLDKDLLFARNKVYSEHTCVFIPHTINGLLAIGQRTKFRDISLPKGVSWCESEGKYKAYCAQLNGKNKTLGRFTDVREAGYAYVDFKRKMALECLDLYGDIIDPRAAAVLKDFNIIDYIDPLECSFKY